MNDSYNLGWKIASVVLGTLKPEILTTYQMERLPVALQLLSFDKTIYDAICPKSRKYSKDQLVDVLRQENTSASGLFIIYSENMTISTQFENEKQRKTENVNHQISCLASKVTIGGRFPDQVVIRHSDSRPCHMLDLLPGSGQWHLLVFGGNIADKTQMARLRSAGHFLGHERSIFFKANRERLKTAFGSFEVFLIHSAVRHNIELFDLPRVFLPFDETYGYDYSKVYADNVSYQGCGGSAYSNYGISNDGCIILVRPDQHVAFICGLEGTSLLEEFVSRFHYMA
ncbi:hypothetical protein QQS21_005662 [Conoideocrella luteorostrata]|uniref:FAD-binding domain-containing protein n=1 Tax=Conoideocrella luteorostrata TaxID=1105319 RepID=A0AAJ0CT96_9HYPO|nr:hypothetical protein QQS21_005662 [Conoideocrella luteorostrata]